MDGGMKRDTSTWAEHAAIATLGPFAVGLVNHSLGLVAFAAWALLAYFVGIREYLDRKMHLARGDWDTPSARDGVTPRVDRWGDLVGPVTAAVAYTLAWWLA